MFSEKTLETELPDAGSPGQVRPSSRLRAGSVAPKQEHRPSMSRKSENQPLKSQDGPTSGRSSVVKEDRVGRTVVYPDAGLEDKPLTFFSSTPTAAAGTGLRKKSVMIKTPSNHEQPRDPPPIIDEDQELVDRLFATTSKEDPSGSIKGKAEPKPAEKASLPSVLKEDRRPRQVSAPTEPKLSLKALMNVDPTLTEVDKAWFEAVAGRLSDADDDSRGDIFDDVQKEEARMERMGRDDDAEFRKRLISSHDVKEQWARQQKLLGSASKQTDEPVDVGSPGPPAQGVLKVAGEALQVSEPAPDDVSVGVDAVEEKVVDEEKGDGERPELPPKDPSGRPKSRMASASRKGSKKKSLTVTSISGRPASSRNRTPK
ncbi:hypothetical protein HDU67_008384 [Dinochytrium kinnereticum]|nr:hypothetical protein HDU67_008384 [Dinochytrium kinnereticum]